MTTTKFTDEVEIDAPTQVGLVVTGPVTGVGAGAQLATTGTGGRGWEILATGHASAQGQNKLNIRDLGNGQDVFTITSDGKVGIGTTSPPYMLSVSAPDEGGISVSGPSAGIGAGITLGTRGTLAISGSIPQPLPAPPPAWQILATGDKASQGAGKLNIAYQFGFGQSADVLTMAGTGSTTLHGSGDPLLALNHTGSFGNPALWFEQDGAAKAFMWWGQQNNTLNLGTPVTNPIISIQNSGTTTVEGSADPLLVVNHLGGSGNPALWFEQDGAAKAFIWWDQQNNALNLGTPVTNPIVSIQNNGTVQVTGDIVMPASDFAEDFAVDASDAIEPGTVMVLDDAGTLRASTKGYDKKVAGVVSGAGDCRPGLILDRREFSSERRLPVALVGKVYCKVDAAFGAIEVGDLLTSSPIPGHAMKATDQIKAFGAVIGKAMRPLKSGRGLIPILIALQ